MLPRTPRFPSESGWLWDYLGDAELDNWGIPDYYSRCLGILDDEGGQGIIWAAFPGDDAVASDIETWCARICTRGDRLICLLLLRKTDHETPNYTYRVRKSRNGHHRAWGLVGSLSGGAHLHHMTIRRSSFITFAYLDDDSDCVGSETRLFDTLAEL